MKAQELFFYFSDPQVFFFDASFISNFVIESRVLSNFEPSFFFSLSLLLFLHWSEELLAPASLPMNFTSPPLFLLAVSYVSSFPNFPGVSHATPPAIFPNRPTSV